MAKQSHIPLEFIQKGFLEGHQRIVKFVIDLKMNEGYKIDKRKYSRELLGLAFKGGYITKCRKTNEYYQRSWRTLCKDFKSVTYVTIEHWFWLRHSFQDIAYLAALAYLLRLQEKRKPHGIERNTLKLSVHYGGVSHSLISEWFGKKSKAWSVLRRDSLKKNKLVRFRRRHRRVKGWGKIPKGDHPQMKGHYVTHNGVAREIASKVTILSAVYFTVPSWVRKERKGA